MAEFIPIEVYKLRNTLPFEPFTYDYETFSVNFFRNATFESLNQLTIPISTEGVQDKLPEVFIQAPFIMIRSDIADNILTLLDKSHTKYSKTIFTCKRVTYFGVRAWDNFSLKPNSLMFRGLTSQDSNKTSYLQFYSVSFFHALEKLKYDGGIKAVSSIIYRHEP